MSAETKEALEAAMQEHIRDEAGPNRMLGDYIMTMAYINLEEGPGRTGYYHEVRGPMHGSLGLTEMQGIFLSEQIGDDEPE